MERSSSHPPLPETSRQGYEVDSVAGMAHPAIGKISMGAAAEWFEKEKFHGYTLRLHTHADAQRRRLRRVGKTRLNMPKFERSDFYRLGHVTLGYHLSTVLYCRPRSDLVDFTGNKAPGFRFQVSEMGNTKAETCWSEAAAGNTETSI